MYEKEREFNEFIAEQTRQCWGCVKSRKRYFKLKGGSKWHN